MQTTRASNKALSWLVCGILLVGSLAGLAGCPEHPGGGGTIGKGGPAPAAPVPAASSK